jgi:rSAM/selenodomain-associated transferase 1
MPRPAVIIMAKAPRAGEAKTRLAPPLTPDEAAALAACFFADAVSLARRVAGETVVAYAPADGRAMLEDILRGGCMLWLEQRGDSLGERLAGVVERAAALALSPLVVVGTDSPTLPSSFLATAFDALALGPADVALGPAEDGGFYAVGLRLPAPGLFDAVEWSTPRAYAQTARNAARLGLRLLELPRWYDVDTPADLVRLREELAADEDARRRAPATYEWMKQRVESSSRKLDVEIPDLKSHI